MPEAKSESKNKSEKEFEKLQEKKFSESTVKRALIRFYSQKYRNLSKEEMEKRIVKELINTVPGEMKDQVEQGLTKMGYAIGKNYSDIRSLSDVEKFIDNEVGYTLIYDSFSEGLEPVYFWIVDWMRDNYWGLGMDVQKTLDEFQGSVGSGFFGDLGTRASIMQDRAMKMLTTINSVVRSIINILYDLKEFDQRLDLYKKLKSDNDVEKKNARLSLKQIWMDRVDMQRGRGSINMLAQQLQFVTLRDAFMTAESVENVDDMDLNDRVKRILAPRLQEYLAWEKLSEAELTRRYKIEKSYLKSQVNSLKLYSQWARPYLKTAQQLTASDYRTPNLVSIFNNMQVQLSVFGKRSVKPEAIVSTRPFIKNKYAAVKLDKGLYACVEVTMVFRTIPHTITRGESGTHYAQGGKVYIKFRAFGLDQDEVDAVEKEELYQGLELIQSMTHDSLEAIQEEISKYLDRDENLPETKEERLEKLQELLNTIDDKRTAERVQKEIKELEKELRPKEKFAPFEAIAKGFDEITDPLKNLWKPKMEKEKVAAMTRNSAKRSAAVSSYLIYNVYKKSHGMITE
ncbi:hypothetical protein HYT56_04325 [Candidatus Woesearchaeota archaeon]|nr:hypothetical protein [Candidatus Woesearchaeota archaeon]